jgi:hypothetical protein
LVSSFDLDWKSHSLQVIFFPFPHHSIFKNTSLLFMFWFHLILFLCVVFMLRDMEFGVLWVVIVSKQDIVVFNGQMFGTSLWWKFFNFWLEIAIYFCTEIQSFSISLLWFVIFFVSAETIRLFIELFVWNFLIKSVLCKKRKNFLDSEEERNLLMDDLEEDAELKAIN